MNEKRRRNDRQDDLSQDQSQAQQSSAAHPTQKSLRSPNFGAEILNPISSDTPPPKRRILSTPISSGEELIGASTAHQRIGASDDRSQQPPHSQIPLGRVGPVPPPGSGVILSTGEHLMTGITQATEGLSLTSSMPSVPHHSVQASALYPQSRAYGQSTASDSDTSGLPEGWSPYWDKATEINCWKDKHGIVRWELPPSYRPVSRPSLAGWTPQEIVTRIPPSFEIGLKDKAESVTLNPENFDWDPVSEGGLSIWVIWALGGGPHKLTGQNRPGRKYFSGAAMAHRKKIEENIYQATRRHNFKSRLERRQSSQVPRDSTQTIAGTANIEAYLKENVHPQDIIDERNTLFSQTKTSGE